MLAYYKIEFKQKGEPSDIWALLHKIDTIEKAKAYIKKLKDFDSEWLEFFYRIVAVNYEIVWSDVNQVNLMDGGVLTHTVDPCYGTEKISFLTHIIEVRNEKV